MIYDIDDYFPSNLCPSVFRNISLDFECLSFDQSDYNFFGEKCVRAVKDDREFRYIQTAAEIRKEMIARDLKEKLERQANKKAAKLRAEAIEREQALREFYARKTRLTDYFKNFNNDPDISFEDAEKALPELERELREITNKHKKRDMRTYNRDLNRSRKVAKAIRVCKELIEMNSQGDVV